MTTVLCNRLLQLPLAIVCLLLLTFSCCICCCCCCCPLAAAAAAAPASATGRHPSSLSADDDDFNFVLGSAAASVRHGPAVEGQTEEGPAAVAAYQPRRSGTRPDPPPSRRQPRGSRPDPRRRFRRPEREQLNCPIYYFPAPNQHIFCCFKEDFCKCPRPMGVCDGVSYEDLFSGHGGLVD